MPLVIKQAGFEDLLTSGDYYLKALIIGEHGSGKTPFAAQWPKPIFAMCENGHMSLARNGATYADIDSSADMRALLDKLKIEARKPIASRQFQTLVIDTIDSYQRRLIQERLKVTKAEGLSGWADWGWLDGKMMGLIEELNALAMNVVVLMHTKDVEEDGEGDAKTVTQRARMKGDIKESVFQDFPLIGLMETYYAAGTTPEGKAGRVQKRRLRWRPDPKHPVLRDQSTKLPQFTDVDFTSDDYLRIFEAITQGLDDLPEAKEIETIEVPEAEVPEHVDEVGALEKPALPPAKKTAAKKAAAKKAAPKKAAEPEPKPAPEPEQAPAPEEPVAEATPLEEAPAAEPEPIGEDPWTAPAEAEPPASDESAEALLSEELGATEVKEEPKQAPTKTTLPQRICGSQPKTFAGKYDAVAGCGRPIAPNDTTASVSVVKFKTFLCGQCFELTSNG